MLQILWAYFYKLLYDIKMHHRNIILNKYISSAAEELELIWIELQ